MDRRLSYFDNISECIYTNYSSISLYKYPIEKYNLSILKNRGNDDSETFNSEGNALQKSYMLLIIILKSKPLQSLIRFKSAVMSSPNILKYRFNYCIELEQIGFRAKAKSEYVLLLSLYPLFIDGWVNLAALYLKDKELDKALSCILISVSLDPNNSNAFYNLNNILRISGSTKFIIELMNEYLNKKYNIPYFNTEKTIENIKSDDIYTIICVKWGKKYGSEYVNKLSRAIKKYFHHSYKFIVLTDDKEGINEDIKIISLPLGLEGWWNKIYIFNIPTDSERCIYIDLDTVICGDIDFLAYFSEDFGILGTEDFSNEQRKDGYNSSIVLWNSKNYSCLTTHFLKYKDIFLQYVYRLDHWLEMMIPNATILQKTYPKYFLEYVHDCKNKEIPDDGRIINFPLNPKPHQIKDPWISKYWI